MKLNMETFVLFLLLTILGSTQSAVIDIKKFGGAPNADITQALTKAWDEACASTTATKIVIPGGTYKMNAIQVKGPCKAPIEINVAGIIQAPPDPNAMNDAYEWIKIEHVDFLTISGHGVFDGQGAKAWKENDCGTNQKCKKRSLQHLTKLANELNLFWAPSKIKISKVTFKNIKGTSKTKEGVILMCSSGVPCDGVELSDINLTFNGAPIDAKCANVKPLITGKAPACKA
uniref:Polygalacturonase n=1 Tax=Cajanus cajan TaxID=3821 RepID=A0A151S004_CAJCA|nr:Polygalacturonase [Cajanus cajan]